MNTRVRILIVVARVDFFEKGILKNVKTGYPLFSSTTLVNLANAESGLGSKLFRLEFRVNTGTFAELMPSRPSGWEWRYVLSHFINIIYGANTRKTFRSDEPNANREQPITSNHHTNFNMASWLQWIPFRKTELWKQKFRIHKRLLRRGILSKSNRLLLFLIQICGFRKARCSVADWSYFTDKRIGTVCNIENHPEFLDVMKMWISCSTISWGIQNLPGAANFDFANFSLILARTRDLGPINLSRVASWSENTNPREKMTRFSRDFRDGKWSKRMCSIPFHLWYRTLWKSPWDVQH